MNSMELFVREHLTKYRMHEIEALIEDLSKEEKHGIDGHDGEKLKNLYSDLGSIFKDARFMKEYENIIERERMVKDNMNFEEFDSCLNVKYFPPKKIDWSELLGDKKDQNESKIKKVIEQVKKGDIGTDLMGINKDSDKTDNNRNRNTCFVTELENIPNSIRDYMYKHGIMKLRQGKVGVIIMSGGDGSRLGYNGPKGMYPIGKISKDSFFKIFCQKIQSLIRLVSKENYDHDTDDLKSEETKYLKGIPLYIMTSENNDSTIKKYFKENENFGLKDVTFFKQDSVPSLNINKNYSFFLNKDLRIVKSPNGNGGIFNCMKKQGIIDDMNNKGVEYVFIHCIDNPLCKICDPFFIGYSDLLNLQVSTKTIYKKDINENIGSIAQKLIQDSNKSNNIIPCIIEYTELNKLGDKKENFAFGSIGIHLFQLQFIQEISNKLFELPYHIANKKIPYLKYLNDHDNSRLKFYIDKPSENNGIKLETFIFDSFAFTNIPVHCINVSRDEFSPVKSISGQDSPETCQKAISDLNKKLINRALNISEEMSLSLFKYIEISPLVSYNGENLDRFTQLKIHNKNKLIYINDCGQIVLLDELQ
ncbi:UTP--glucose-1-phosphate uridylyltransferase family protein [Cryptosporidium meleagridis]|uniref:UDP-N-acetylglucosamine diphosphorylase n=1 Tax=Cryptosporidium meleagridis TaxID=93969 RepID=A0A2P4YZH2_9CRYT|nr:UTP--glucose-1-phosphate uridylyltransferase family protein [Cryptosporidium meleagridis]